jgi:hypothetical protein
MPCGSDRILSEADLKTFVIKPDNVTKVLLTQVSGSRAGKQILLGFYPGGKFEAGIVNSGGNIGKEWKLEGNELCSSYTGVENGNGTFQCRKFELTSGKLYVVGTSGSRNPVHSIEFTKP